MPPSPPGAVSGVWRTAQRTIKNSATMGIFKKNINQMKVHVSTRLDRTTRRRVRTTPQLVSVEIRNRRALGSYGAWLNWVIACSSVRRAAISSSVRRSTRSVPNSSTLNDASTVA